MLVFQYFLRIRDAWRIVKQAPWNLFLNKQFLSSIVDSEGIPQIILRQMGSFGKATI